MKAVVRLRYMSDLGKDLLLVGVAARAYGDGAHVHAGRERPEVLVGAFQHALHCAGLHEHTHTHQRAVRRRQWDEKSKPHERSCRAHP